MDYIEGSGFFTDKLGPFPRIAWMIFAAAVIIVVVIVLIVVLTDGNGNGNGIVPPSPESACTAQGGTWDGVICILPPLETLTIAGRDLPGFDIAGAATTATSADDCQSICANNPNCDTYTYVEQAGRVTNCYPKQMPTLRAVFEGGQTGLSGVTTVLNNKDLPGRDLFENGQILCIQPAVDANEYSQRCTDNPNCHAYTYLNSSGHCCQKGLPALAGAVTGIPLTK